MSYIASLGAKIQGVVKALLIRLNLKPLGKSITDSLSGMLDRNMPDIIIENAIFLLHRCRFVNGSTGKDKNRFYDSCIEVALFILEYQCCMYEGIQPLGTMHAIRGGLSCHLNVNYFEPS
jgi:hypothetical protein